jgi:hypothetical protein
MSQDYRSNFPKKYLKILEEFDSTFLAKNVSPEKIEVDFRYEVWFDDPWITFSIAPNGKREDKTHIRIEIEYDANHDYPWWMSKIEGPIYEFSEIVETARESLESLCEKLLNEDCQKLSKWINEWENIDDAQIALIQSTSWQNKQTWDGAPKNINFGFAQNRRRVYWSDETCGMEDEDLPDCWCSGVWNPYNVFGEGTTPLESLQDATANSKKLITDMENIVKIILEEKHD